MNTRIAAMSVMFCAATAAANPTVTIDRVIQRWPWNNKVDVTYTVANGQDPANNKFYRMDFVAECGGTVQTIDGVHDVGASTDTGTHTVTWTLPDGIKATDCTLTARIYSADVPGGDDYMILNLQTGAISYEGLMGSQAASNERYNSALYKTTNMVFRKIARTADSAFPNGYPTGDNSGYNNESQAAYSPATNWVTTLDYYIGVFPVTQWQYNEVSDKNPSKFKDDSAGNVAAYRPVENISWGDTRGATAGFVTTNAVSPSSTSGAFLRRLNAKTLAQNGTTGFDLPTEVMWEIACRAGATSRYWWGTKDANSDKTYAVWGMDTTVEVGTKLPNALGLYDMAGNVYEWVLDDNSRACMTDAPDPWTAACGGSSVTKRMLRGGGAYSTDYSSNFGNFRASYRSKDEYGTAYYQFGFRVAFIVR